MNKKKVLVLNGSFCEIPIIKELKDEGYYVITTGNMPNLDGHNYADEYIKADYSDKEEILKLVKDNSIDQIVSCANDFGVLTTAYVAEKMGWKGHDSFENASLLHHKDLFRNYCRKHRLPSPRFEVFNKLSDAAIYCKSIEYPIMIKANDLTGGKGVYKANNEKDAGKYLKIAFDKSRDKHIVIEDYIAGEQFSFWGFISNGNVIATCSNDCFSFVNPYLIQAEIYPSKEIEEKYKDDLIQIVEYISKDLKLTDGLICLQIIISKGQIYIIETMRRAFGNDALSLGEKGTGFPWIKAYVYASLGKECKDFKADWDGKYYGHFGIMAKKNGIVTSYEIPNEIKEHMYRFIEVNGVGSRIEDFKNQRIGYLFYSYDSEEEVKDAVMQMSRDLFVEIE